MVTVVRVVAVRFQRIQAGGAFSMISVASFM